MNKILILLLSFFFITAQISAQGLFDKIKEKVKDRVDQKTDEAIDEGLDKTDEEITKDSEEQESEQAEENEEESDAPEPIKKSSDEKKPKDKLQTYSKYDFVPGEKVIFYEDFAQDALGDFPALWNTNASGEVMTTNLLPGKWFKIKNEGAFIPEVFTEPFPENYTIEYDVIPQKYKEDAQNVNYEFAIYADETGNDFTGIIPGYGGVKINYGIYGHNYSGWSEGHYTKTGDSEQNPLVEDQLQHVSIWIQKQRMRVYLDGVKVFDVPKLLETDKKYNFIRFNIWGCEGEPLVSNIRFAVGAPDMRSKLLTEGKLVTRGILFDVNSDKIKPESYGTLKQIAGVLQENADVRVKIIGHTDSDGADAANLELSKKRSVSVMNFLNKEFSIDASRMETDGKGESEPSDKNDTPQGKANNRRVEFIKL